MKAIFCTLALAVATLPAASLTPAERQFALDQLGKSSKIFLASIDGVSASQWSFKPGPDRWSVAECAEHVVIADEMMFTFLSQQLIKMPPVADAKPRQDAAVLNSAA